MSEFTKKSLGGRKAVLAACVLVLVGAIAAAASAAALANGRSTTASAQSNPSPTAAASYKPQTHSFTVSIVPLVVHEQQSYEDYLAKDFAPGGVLDGKEIYGYYPSTLVVYKGDTVNINWVNPTDDPHINVIPEFQVSVTQNGESTAHSSFVASKVGTFTFLCAEAEHSPYMWGQIVVLPDSDAQ